MNARQVAEVSIQATVIRADGTVETLGEVGYYHRNPARRWFRNTVRRVRTGRAGAVTVEKEK